MIKEKSVDFVLATPQVSKDSHWLYKKGSTAHSITDAVEIRPLLYIPTHL